MTLCCIDIFIFGWKHWKERRKEKEGGRKAGRKERRERVSVIEKEGEEGRN